MCGIYATTKNITESEIQKKLNVINHRGPDNSDFLINDKFSFGHNRLSIIDLDERSNQPFEYNGYYIVFNGEIYDHLELKKNLAAIGYSFRTTSDTEILLASYIEYGEKCLEMLNGMFAFIIYDPNKNLLFGARDRYGKKPLYYKLHDNSIECASQLSQLTITNENKISEIATHAYLKYKYIPSPLSIYDDVYKLEAGSSFSYSLANNKFNLKKYYSLQAKQKDKKNITYNQAITDLEELLHSAVKLRLIADVPVGVFLSGGIDSSLVAAVAQQQSHKPINTFCIKFQDEAYDESKAASDVASHIGTNHTTIECSPNDLLDFIYKYADCYDEPFADSSSLPSMLLSRVARKHVTVALTGDGADETFLGYNRYETLRKIDNLYKLPQSIRKISSLVPKKVLNSRLQTIIRLLSLNNAGDFYHSFMQGLDQKYFKGDPELCLTKYKNYLYATKNIIANAGLYDTLTYLPDDINVKIDRASMFSSLELRAPFLDYRIVEFGSSLPTHYRIIKGKKKKILRDLANLYLPKEIINRPKSGFSAPIGDWFRYDLNEFVMNTCSRENLKKVPNLDLLETHKMIDLHMAGKANKQSEIFKLLVYVLWMQKWS